MARGAVPGAPAPLGRFLLLPALLLPSLPPALAETVGPDGTRRPDFTFDVGGGGVFKPEFEGGDAYEIDPIPAFDIRFRDWIFLSTSRGLGLDLIQDGDQAWRAGPIVSYRRPREEDDSGALRGLGDVEGTVEAGAYLEYTPFPFGGKLEVRHGFGGHRGVLVDLGVSYREKLTDELLISLGPGATWASDDYMESYFGISDLQSSRSGYAAFDADAGFKDVSFGVALSYAPVPYLALTGFANYERLLDDAAASPLVAQGGSPNQVTLGVTMTFRFGFDAW
jgi:outer membrane protein